MNYMRSFMILKKKKQLHCEPSFQKDTKKEDNDKAKAPGMKYTHYSPDADVYIVSGDERDVIDKINSLVEKNKFGGW